MRVIAGSARSLPLKCPEGLDVRPTTDRIKETLFNMLQADVPGSIFLDLFSGSGAIGIEALSRGAEKAYFLENSVKAFSCISQNLAFTKLENRAIVIKQDVCSALGSIREREVDLVFLDPPYQSGYEQDVLRVLGTMPYVTAQTLIIVEASLEAAFPYLRELGFFLDREKRYKTNKHVFIRKTRPV